MANEIFFFDSTDVGSPTLNNVAGSMVAVLDACLVNGFNSKSVTSVVVAGNIATVTCTSHGFVAVPGKLVEMGGATPSGLNGLKTVLTVANANTFTYAAPGISDQTATGTITAKRAGIGWGKPFTGTNKAVYRSADVTGTRLYMRIDDTNSSPATATDPRVTMYESMSDVDTGTAPCPTAAQLASGQFWNKGVNNTTAKTWTLIGDGRLFYFFTQQAAASVQMMHMFGDLVSYRASDAYGCILGGYATAFNGSNSGTVRVCAAGLIGGSPDTFGYVIARIGSQTGACVRAVNYTFASSSLALIGASGAPSYPSPIDNGIVLSRPVYVGEENSSFNNPIRGELPGAMGPMASVPFSHLEVITGITGLSGSAVAVATAGNASAAGRIVFDISNSWR